MASNNEACDSWARVIMSNSCCGEKGAPSAVPCTSTISPCSVRMMLASTSACESSL